MKKIVYLEDEAGARATYTRVLRRMFRDEFEIFSPELEETIPLMLESFSLVDGVVSYVIDENLVHTGVARYVGTELIDKLRDVDSKVPVYVLTSFSNVSPFLGNIEFVIDKNSLSGDEFRENVAARIRRHIDVYIDILSARGTRLDELLRKHVSGNLSVDESKELDELNYIRSKNILLEEKQAAESLKADLDRQSVLLELIDQRLNEMDEK